MSNKLRSPSLLKKIVDADNVAEVKIKFLLSSRTYEIDLIVNPSVWKSGAHCLSVTDLQEVPNY